MTTQATATGLDNRQLVTSKGFLAQLEKAAPRHVSAERLSRVAQTAITKNPALLRCSQASFAASVLQAAELGLEPSGALGHAYLVPYGTDCQLIISYKGMIALARRSGEIVSIEARAVYERDSFSLRFGIDATVEHVPYLDGERGPLKFVYAVAKLAGGGVQLDVMNRTEVEAIRNRSKAGKSGPWVTDFDEMAKKTVLRRLFKMLPVSVELAEAIEKGDAIEFGEPTNIGNVSVPAATSSGRTGAVEEALTAPAELEAPAPTYAWKSADAFKLFERIGNAPNPGEMPKLAAEIDAYEKKKGVEAADVAELRAAHARVVEEFARAENGG